MTTGGVDTYLFGIPFAKLPEFATVEPVGNKPVAQRETIDHDALDDVMSFIKAHPTTWRQQSWYKTVNSETGEIEYVSREEEVELVNSCGASFCFAGHAAIRAGFPAPPLSNDVEWVRNVVDPNENFDWDESVSEFAQAVLGLEDEQAAALFDGDNSMENLEVMVEVLHRRPEIHGWDLDMVRVKEFDSAEEFLHWFDES